jgi:hypothetical protein
MKILTLAGLLSIALTACASTPDARFASSVACARPAARLVFTSLANGGIDIDCKPVVADAD